MGNFAAIRQKQKSKKTAFKVVAATFSAALVLSSLTFITPPTQAVEVSSKDAVDVQPVPVTEVTESEVEFVETRVEANYTESGPVPEGVGNEQQAEAVTVQENVDPATEVDIHIARADIESDVVVVGATWDLETLAPESVHLRYLEFGTWSKWTELDVEEIPSVEDGVEPTRAGTEPFTLTNGSAVEVVARAADGASLPGLNLTVIDARGMAPVENKLVVEQAEASEAAEPATESDFEVPVVEGPQEVGPEAEQPAEPTQDGTKVGQQTTEKDGANKDVLLDTEGAVVADPSAYGARAVLDSVFGSSPASLAPMKLNSAGTEYDTGFNGLKIKTRKAWGANESWMTWPPQSIKIKGGVVHHTEGNNNYTQAQVPGQIQGVYRYHAQTLGWGDIGYNLVVDKFGGVWEGRAGGLTNAIQGAQAYGANAETFGISLFGNYMYTAPPVVARQALAKATAWKLKVHGINSSAGTIYVPGSDKRGRNIPVVSGHRDVGGTDCPGDAFYAQMGTVRSEVEGYLKTNVNPDPKPPTPPAPYNPSSPKVPGWDAGSIISDASFFKPNAMTEGQIKTFIEKEGAACKGSAANKTTCLKDTKFPTQKLVTDRGGCKPLNLTGSQTPWKIISETSAACGINPQVLLTMIQKESSGIYQAKTAEGWAKVMGNACPTGQGCDPAQAGFQKQIYYGADKLVSYKLKPTWWPYIDSVAKKTPVTIPYASNASCGGQTFVIKNVATASLYTYNPFVPNQAALDSYPGGGGGCEHTGNRNFYMYMKKWFPESMDGGDDVNPVPPPKPDDPVSPITWLARKQIGNGWPTNVIYPGDWNGNGYADMMLINDRGQLLFYSGMSGERFQSPVQIGNGWNVMDWVQGGVDWTGDGNMDILARVSSTGELRVYPGNGRGGFKAPQSLGTGWNDYSQIVATKTAQGPALYAIEGNRMIYFPSSGGKLQAAQPLGTGWSVMTALVPSGDWTGDGVPDLLARQDDGRLYLYEGRTNGTPGARVQVGKGWQTMQAIGVSDQNQTKSGVWAIDSSGKLWSYKIR